MVNKGEIIIYQSEDNQTQIDVRLENETVWLTQEYMALLFQRDRSVVTKHINNIFKEGELPEISNVQKMHITNSDKPTKFYSLDVIISVGYRVKSIRGTQFRIWANKILKDYLIRGYSINEKLLKEKNEKIRDLHNAIKLISYISKKGLLSKAENESIIYLMEKYSESLTVLDNYDYQKLNEISKIQQSSYKLQFEEVIDIIDDMRKLIGNSGLFGRQKDESLKSSISTIYQTFGGIDLYPSIEEKAANLLYFLVKNHSFIDGN